MKNFIQHGNTLSLAAPYALDAGDGALIGSIFGVASCDAENGASVELVTTGVFTLPKVSTDVIAIGAPLYWDDSAKLITTDDDSAANPQVGVAVSAAGNPSASVNVKLTDVMWLPEPA
jgi:predicted RecA/RadA family phage recombinase